jgi:hypothetical protein
LSRRVIERRIISVHFVEDDPSDTLRTWNVETGQIVASINQNFYDACFAANGRVLVVAIRQRIRNEIAFYDLARPDRVPQRVPGGFFYNALAVSPNGGLVSASTGDAQVLLLDPAMGSELSWRGYCLRVFE